MNAGLAWFPAVRFSSPSPPGRHLLSGIDAAGGAPAETAPTGADPFIEALIGRMTLEGNAGQLPLYADMVRLGAAESNPENFCQPKALAVIRAGRVTNYFNGIGTAADAELQKVAVEESRRRIPLIFVADVAHGLKVVFSTPLGKASNFEPDLCRRTARTAAIETTARGIQRI